MKDFPLRLRHHGWFVIGAGARLQPIQDPPAPSALTPVREHHFQPALLERLVRARCRTIEPALDLRRPPSVQRGFWITPPTLGRVCYRALVYTEADGRL
jgi:hypothetical protein